jgi:predicted component of type VI protein secretion system
MLDEVEISLAAQDIDLPLAVLLLNDLPQNAPQEANRFPAIEL